MSSGLKAAALLCSAALTCAGGAISSSRATETIPGWPAYIAMGAIGGPDGTPLSCSTTAGAGEDDFQGAPLDVVFSYSGSSGNGDPGTIDPPYKALEMTVDFDALSGCPNNNRATRVAMVEYTAQMSGGVQTTDFTDSGSPSGPNSLSQPNPDYIMARHFISLAADAIALNGPRVSGAGQYAYGGPVTYSGSNYYGTLILNPDGLGTIEQGGASAVNTVNSALPAGAVNAAVSIALCFLTTSQSYTNTYNPNGLSSPPYLKTYTGTPVQILEQMLADGYPLYSVNYSPTDPYWPTSTDNITVTYSMTGGSNTYALSQVGSWLYACAGNPTYNKTTYQVPTFPAGLDGWVQANNWLIRTFAPKGTVTFGWQEDMYAGSGSDFWLQAYLTRSQVASTYSGPVTSFLQNNAPSAISSSAPLGAAYVPDYFLFDRFGTDDSSDSYYLGGATLYNAQSWDNYLVGIGQVSANFSNIPVMMWQIPASHISNKTETMPEYYNNTQGDGYIFSTAPVYFFGDSNLTSNLSNIATGTPSSVPTTAAGNFEFGSYCGAPYYANCYNNADYQQYLLSYQTPTAPSPTNNYNWSIDNGKRYMAVDNHVFAILWGCGGCTNVVQNAANACQCNDNGWLQNKIINYYQKPAFLALSDTHDFNDTGRSDILWRDSSGDVAMWLMNGAAVTQSAGVGTSPATWSIVGQRDLNGQGDADVLWHDSSGDVAVWLMNGATVSQSLSVGSAPGWSIVGTGDFFGDGLGDILWYNGGSVAIWELKGGAVTQSCAVGSAPTSWSIVGAGDFDGNGSWDILWHDTSGDVAIWFMNGCTVTQSAGVGKAPTNWSIVGTGDFAGSGRSSILWHDTVGDVAIWFMNGATVTQSAGVGNAPTTWSIAQTGDYYGNGKSDILWTDTSGNVAVWQMNGAAIAQSAGVGSAPTSWSIQGAGAD